MNAHIAKFIISALTLIPGIMKYHAVIRGPGMGSAVQTVPIALMEDANTQGIVEKIGKDGFPRQHICMKT